MRVESGEIKLEEGRKKEEEAGVRDEKECKLKERGSRDESSPVAVLLYPLSHKLRCMRRTIESRFTVTLSFSPLLLLGFFCRKIDSTTELLLFLPQYLRGERGREE